MTEEEELPLGRILKTIPPLDPEGVAEQALDQDDKRAAFEAIGFAEGDLEQRSREREFDRTETLRDHVHTLSVCGIWTAGFLFIAAVIVTSCHFLAPPRYTWLSPDQLHILISVVASGTVTGAVRGYLSRRVP